MQTFGINGAVDFWRFLAGFQLLKNEISFVSLCFIKGARNSNCLKNGHVGSIGSPPALPDGLYSFLTFINLSRKFLNVFRARFISKKKQCVNFGYFQLDIFYKNYPIM